MQKELEELQPKLVEASAENERMLVVIEKESTEVEATSKVVKQEEKGANEKAAEAQALKDEVCVSLCVVVSVCLSVCLCIYLSIYIRTYITGVCKYVHTYICLRRSVGMSVRMYVSLSWVFLCPKWSVPSHCCVAGVGWSFPSSPTLCYSPTTCTV